MTFSQRTSLVLTTVITAMFLYATAAQAKKPDNPGGGGVWSPTGSHLLSAHDDHFNDNSYVVRATSAGKDKQRITDANFATGLNDPRPLGWREAPSATTVAVPEPSSQLLVLSGVLVCLVVSRLRIRRLHAIGSALLVLSYLPLDAIADTFVTGVNEFTIDFVQIGDSGNSADTNNSGLTVGSVDYVYRMSKFEVSRDMVAKANAEGDLGLTLWDMSFVTGGARPDMPASGLSWNEAARFVNWLNVRKGFSPAYMFSSQPGDAGYDPDANIDLWEPGDPGFDAANPFRNNLARYFLPSWDEWYKAAYYDPTANGGSGGYWDYPTGSDRPPLAVASGTEPETAVYGNTQKLGPANITQAGGLSPYGLMGMGGNVAEWLETEIDLVNDNGSANRIYRGSHWSPSSPLSMSVDARSNDNPATFERTIGFDVGFRVASASVPEPSTFALLVLGTAVLSTRRRK